MSSAVCEVKNGSGSYTSTTNGVNVTPGNTITIRLASGAGSDTWTLECIATDETSTAPTLTIDYVTATATFVMDSTKGKAFIFRSTTITNGDTTGIPDVRTFGIYTLTNGGYRVLATNEMLESHATYGWINTVNAGLRNAGAIAAFNTAYTVDFTSQSAQTISANGTVTIDGKAWTYANFANTNAANISASGLTLAPNATNSSYANATRTCPIISIPVSSLISGFDVSANEVRLSVYLSSTNADAATELFYAGFESTSSPVGSNVMVGKGFVAATSIRSAFGVASSSTNSDDTTNTTDNVLVVQYAPRLLRAETRTGIWSSGFPTTTRARRYMSLGGGVAGMYSTSTDLSLFLAAQSGNTSNNFSVTIAALKLEVIS